MKEFCKNFEGNINYKLKGVIAYFEQDVINKYFIAYCCHGINNEWYCYNNTSVSKLEDQINGYKNGIPYILFYKAKNNYNNFLFPENINFEK